ncbi:MAG: hypothetical protein ACK4QP_11215 [Pseudorhizobium sp.]
MRSDQSASLEADRPAFSVSQSFAEDCMHLVSAATLMLIAISCFVISTTLGVAAVFIATATVASVRPTSLPTVIVTSFLYQNTVISAFGPLVGSGDAFDALRGANFVVLVAATAVCIFAALVDPRRIPYETRKWLLASVLVLGVITVYLGLGAARGAPRDALVYFRNTVTPVACFIIGLTVASLYKMEMRRAIVALGGGALVFGYCELFFAMDFLSLFNGDEYIQRRIVRQIETGYWERILKDSGFVLRGLEDVMMTPLFNIPGYSDVLPQVFRLSGPNFHPISFAYALAIISIWLIFRNRFGFLIAAAPLLVIIGSKGAMIAVLMALALKFAVGVMPPRTAILGFIAGSLGYITIAVIYGRSVNDYHVLGLLAGLRDFFRNPIGQGLGFGGNLSSSIEGNLDWSRSQLEGIADLPVESAVGVMLYQMGIAALLFFAFLTAIARKCAGLYLRRRNPDALCGFMLVTIISVNAVLQEEAFFSPLALGFALMLVGITMGRTFLIACQERRNSPPERSSTGGSPQLLR